jgi:small subunit ribosomal protein S21
MTVVRAGPGDTTDSLIRKFTKKIVAEGVMQEIRRKEFYQKPSEVRKEEKKERERKKYRRRTFYG